MSEVGDYSLTSVQINEKLFLIRACLWEQIVQEALIFLQKDDLQGQSRRKQKPDVEKTDE